LASKFIFKLAHELGDEVQNFYTDAECDKMLSGDNIEALVEDDFLESVFGLKSRIPGETWLKNVCDEEKDPNASWIFKADDLRDKLL